jgi:hypothetical protein
VKTAVASFMGLGRVALTVKSPELSRLISATSVVRIRVVTRAQHVRQQGTAVPAFHGSSYLSRSPASGVEFRSTFFCFHYFAAIISVFVFDYKFAEKSFGLVAQLTPRFRTLKVLA